MKNFKKIFTILLVVIGIGWLIYATKNSIAKMAVEKGTAMATGLKLDINSFSFGILKTDVDIQGARLFNPTGYQEPIMIDVPKVYVDYDFGALLKKKIHVQAMELEVKELYVIKDASGKLNLDALKKPAKPSKKPAAQEGKKPAEAPAMQIDSLLLKVGKVVYKDYSKNAGSPKIQEYTLNFTGKYSNITDVNQLVHLIIGEALLKSSLGGLANFDVKALEGAVSTESLEKTGGSLIKGVEGLFKKE